MEGEIKKLMVSCVLLSTLSLLQKWASSESAKFDRVFRFRVAVTIGLNLCVLSLSFRAEDGFVWY